MTLLDRPLPSRWQALDEQRRIAEEAKLASAMTPSVSSGGTLTMTPSTLEPASTLAHLSSHSSVRAKPPLSVRCYARTRVPTPHGEVFCHLYRNNHDNKEHLALVVDWEQNDEDAMRSVGGEEVAAPMGKLRSKTLEERWSADETEIERIVRGAYVGRLGASYQRASVAAPRSTAPLAATRTAEEANDAAPLVRIHSECFTGETIGSQRCDCGEQLDEAIRLICASGGSYASGKPRGIVVYLRQEGRGIGLLDKLMAYNLQDMGHDTVSANILLGHVPDARKYDIASAILHDLNVDECRLLTNNPEKMEALEAEGVRVAERVAMVPRVWRNSTRKMKKLQAANSSSGSRRKKAAAAAKSVAGRTRTRESSHLQHSIISQFDAHGADDDDGGSAPHSPKVDSGEGDDADSDADESDSSVDSYVEHALRRSGATMLGGSITRGPELEKYLRTKVERMGHMLVLPPEEAEALRVRSNPGPSEERLAQQSSQQKHDRHQHNKQHSQPMSPANLSPPGSPAPIGATAPRASASKGLLKSALSGSNTAEAPVASAATSSSATADDESISFTSGDEMLRISTTVSDSSQPESILADKELEAMMESSHKSAPEGQ